MTKIPGGLATALADRYRIERELGAGGMATVYLAQDLKHERQVAIKVLRPELAAILGAERFVQEIKTTAALSHPHILPLFDSGEAAGFLYYVMPYIQGETIREKLNRDTQLGIDEAVRITTEVADALDYAHRHGVIHRDIKPENVLLHDGRAMVMDFGIALAVSAAAGGRMTETGLSLGTPHYMSPEQATADKSITARSDVYSLGAVLYEMLAGEPPHSGGSAQQIIMKIIAERAQLVTELRQSVPPNVAAALARALEKLPADRFESAKAFADALGNPAFTSVGSLAAPAAAGRQRWSGVSIAAFAVGLLGIGLAVWRWLSPAPVITPPMLVQVPFASNDSISGYPHGDAWDWGRPTHNAFAFSPDGRALLYTGPGGRLFLRALDGRDSIPIPAVEDAESPFFSPDGRSIGYWSGGRLRRVPTRGGPSTEIAEVPRISGASWSDRNQIAVGIPGVGLVLLSPDGAAPPDTLRGSWALPRFLPGGRSLLVTRIGNFAPFESDVYWLPLDSRRPKLLVSDAADAQVVPTGHVVFGREGTLMAVRFDAKRHEVLGRPFTVLPDVMQAANSGLPETATGATQVAFSPLGQLAWLTGGAGPAWTSEALELDRQGRVTILADAGRRGFLTARLSPDGGRLALTSIGLTSALEVFDLARGTTHTLPTSGQQVTGLWSRDGLRVVATEGSVDSVRIISLQADGVGSPQPIGRPFPQLVFPAFWSPDGSTLYVFSGRLVAVSIADGAEQEVPNLPPGFHDPTLSPDGKWLAYTATEPQSSEPNVYVSPWPALDRKWKLSSGGAASPAWTRAGRELVYLQQLERDNVGNVHVRVMSMDVTHGPVAASTVPRLLFTAEVVVTIGALRSYDVSPDGARFFMIRALPVHATPGRFYVMTNGFAEIRRLAAQQEARR